MKKKPAQTMLSPVVYSVSSRSPWLDPERRERLRRLEEQARAATSEKVTAKEGQA